MNIDELLDAPGRAEALLPRQWIPLHRARDHVVHALCGSRTAVTRDEFSDLVDVLRGATTFRTSFGSALTLVERTARELLIRAFGEGKVSTRGIEHLANGDMVMRQPLASHWWKRIAPPGATVLVDEFAFHDLAWIECTIRRRLPGALDQPSVATITGIEVDQVELFKVVKPRQRGGAGRTGTAMTWLFVEASRRKEHGEPCGRDALVIAVRSKHPEISKRDAITMIEKLPRGLRATRGRRPAKSGRK